MASKYAPTNGIQLHYLDHGGEGPNLFLTHGLTANAHFFNGLAAAGLSDHFHVYAIDLRGRGRSDKPNEGYTMEDHAQDILGLMDHLGIGSVVMAGHSFGGLLTYYLAAHYPDKVEKCIIMDAPAYVDETILEQIQPSLDRLSKTLPTFDDYIEMVKQMPYYEGWWDPTIEQYYRADVDSLPGGGIRSRCHPDHIRQAVEGTLSVPWPKLVESIEQPLLFLRAPEAFGPPNYPPIVPKEKADMTMSHLQNGTIYDIPGNHITYLFGESAALALKHIVEWNAATQVQR